MFQKWQWEYSSQKRIPGVSPGISHQAPQIYTLLNWTDSTVED